MQDKRVDMGGMGDFNGVMGKNPGSRHQLHKESAMDRSPYYDKVRNICGILWMAGGIRRCNVHLGTHMVSGLGHQFGQSTI